MEPLKNIHPDRVYWHNYLRLQASKLRTWFYRQFKCRWLVYDGFVRLPWSVVLWSPHHHIVLGHHVQFGRGCVVECDAEIGNYVLIARNVTFVGRDDHRFDIPCTTIWESPRGDRFKVVVEDDVWIGHGAVILSGVTIGRGAVVSAGAVVTKDVPPYAIIGGNPGELIKWRFEGEERTRHETFLKGKCSDKKS
jgi:chloramphenicol O-acetyltransferase type B